MPRRSHSEATRLLCAGAYLDNDFRGAVIEHLVRHEERPVAPSLGVDVVPVLAYALRARRREAQTGVTLLFLWVAFIVFDYLSGDSLPSMPMAGAIGYAVLCFLLWSTRRSVGRGVYAVDRTTLRKAVPGQRGRIMTLIPLGVRLLAVAYWVLALLGLVLAPESHWPAVAFPLLLTLPIWEHRAHVTGVMRRELARGAFGGLPRAALPSNAHYRRIGESLDREQYAALTIYDPLRPFIGVGLPYEPWSFALDLKRRASAEPGLGPLTGARVIELIRPRIEALRDSATATSRDRLRDLEIEEFVYLPVGAPRVEIPYDRQTVEQHLHDAVDEGGEARRHFLRIRVGGRDEQVGVTVLVRVHTQGGMLVLEVVPHVLTPVKPEYRAADVVAGRTWDGAARDVVRAVLTAPSAGFAAGLSLASTVLAVFGTWLADPERALPDAPETSVRELGSTGEVSLFQEMDISRYVKTIQDRIAGGVRDALADQGYESDQFDQQVVQVSEGSVFIGSMSGGALAVGSGAKARHVVGSDAK
ncbi:hypothetical protein [Embleya sp. NPDC020886]|uniref:hypothetical protein n=1 Tax=Embleya sp. NPDC020886 TaxID=3363980 RepID=UPI0037954F5C